jgi:hypothetical protein
MTLLPTFYKPENYEVEISTHNSIRNLLFNQTIKKIKKVEFFHIRSKSNYFQFKEITKVENDKTITDYYYEKFKKTNLIRTMNWVFERNNTEKRYKVKYYHDTINESFYEKIYPESLFDRLLLKYYILRKVF